MYCDLTRREREADISTRKQKDTFGGAPAHTISDPGTLNGKLLHLLRNFLTAELHSATLPYVLFYNFLAAKLDHVFLRL